MNKDELLLEIKEEIAKELINQRAVGYKEGILACINAIDRYDVDIQGLRKLYMQFLDVVKKEENKIR